MGWSRRIKKIKEYFSDENQSNLDISKLSEDKKSTIKDRGLNIDTNRAQIYETIPVVAIDWILVKDRKMFRLAKLYIDNQRLKLKQFQGNNGNISLGSD